jgi:hypothetical protein
MQQFRLEIRHFVLLAAACVFGVLLWTTGWTWPLEGVAVLLPIASIL